MNVVVPTADEDDDFLFGSKLYLVHLLAVSSSDYHCEGNENCRKLHKKTIGPGNVAALDTDV